MVGSVGWFRVGTVDLYVWKSWLDGLDGTVPSKKLRYSRSVSMVGSLGWSRVGAIDLQCLAPPSHNVFVQRSSMVGLVGWFRVGAIDLYVWKSWLDRLDGMVLSKKIEV